MEDMGLGYIRRIVGGWDCGLYSRRTYDPGTGTGLAEQAGAGPGARVRSTGVSPGQVLPGLHTLRPGGPLGPQGLPSPSPCHLYYVFIGAMGLDCRSGRRPAEPGYRVRPGPSSPPGYMRSKGVGASTLDCQQYHSQYCLGLMAGE